MGADGSTCSGHAGRPQGGLSNIRASSPGHDARRPEARRERVMIDSLEQPNTPKRRRRGNNEGSITQRKDGRWEARISVNSGKRHVLYGKTRKEVQEKLKLSLRELDSGQPP